MRSRLLLPLLVSTAFHAALFGGAAWYHEATVSVNPGVSLIGVRLLPSAGAEAGGPSTTEKPLERVKEPSRVATETPRPTVAEEADAAVEPFERERTAAPVPEMAPRATQDARPEALVQTLVTPSEPPPSAPRAMQDVSCPAIPQPATGEIRKPSPAKTEAAASASPGPGPEPVSSSPADGAVGDEGSDTSPVFQGTCKPRYPRYSRMHGEEGTVVLEWEILASGACGAIRVVRSSGHPRLDRAAIEALRNATFAPAVSAGRPVDSTKRLAFTFRLTDAD